MITLEFVTTYERVSLTGIYAFPRHSTPRRSVFKLFSNVSTDDHYCDDSGSFSSYSINTSISGPADLQQSQHIVSEIQGCKWR